jgi:replicative superfamily II helicase
VSVMPEEKVLSFGRGLSEILEGIDKQDSAKLLNAASTIEALSEEGRISRSSEAFALALAGLAYDAAGETERAKRPYAQMLSSSMPLPLTETLGSEEMAKKITASMAFFGLRRFDALYSNASAVFDNLKTRKIVAQKDTAKDDYLVTLALLDLLSTYDDVVRRKASLGEMGAKVVTFADSVQRMNVSPWLVLLSSLAVKALDMAIKRNVLNFEFADEIRNKLIQKGVIELWPSQIEAVQKGLFKGTNIVFSTPAGTGKSFIAYAAAGQSSPDSKTIYMVPTRTLAEEAYTRLSEIALAGRDVVAISTRDRTEFDESLDEYSILVTTYEKFTALVRKSRIKESSLKCVVVDELHTLSQEDRGIPLELTLTELKSLTGKEDPQMITLSGMLRQEDASGFSEWIDASLIRNDWRPLVVDEGIICQGVIHHKDGREETTAIRANPSASKRWQREEIAKKLVQDIVAHRGQCLVVLESRAGVEDLAEKISSYLLNESSNFDLNVALSEVKSQLDSIVTAIRESEPALSISANKLSEFLKSGVAYHHAGLPRRYRLLVEKGIRDRVIRTVVTTTTFEAGLNLPISHVVFPFPDGRTGNNPMDVNTYRNLAGRAGRPGFDRNGVSVLIALSEVDAKKFRKKYFLSEGDSLSSSLSAFMRRSPEARSAVQAQLLDMSARYRSTRNSLRDFARKTWFWKLAPLDARRTFEKYIDVELWKLQVYGFASVTPIGEVQPTSVGRVANSSVLSPLSVKILIENTRRTLESKRTGDEFDLLVLGLVAIPFEVSNNDEKVKAVKLDERTKFMESIIVPDSKIHERYQRTELARQYSTVLKYWIDPLPTGVVLAKCGLDPSADAALLEELLPRDAYWVLSTVASFPAGTVGLTGVQHKRIRQLAEFCRIGASDPFVIRLLDMGLSHLGRDTAIVLAAYLREREVGIDAMSESDLMRLFSDNREAARLLYTEIQELRKE